MHTPGVVLSVSVGGKWSLCCVQRKKLNCWYVTTKGSGKYLNTKLRDGPFEDELCDMYRSPGVVRVVKCGM
jgi:hypothetical protein